MVLAPHDFNKIRLGRVTNINYDTNLCEVRFYDKFGGARQNIHLAQPYVGRGWGILAGVEAGSLVLIGEETGGDIRLLAYLPQPHFFRDDVNKFDDVSPDESPYRKVQSGEVIIQSKPNSAITLNNVGDVILETPDANIIEINKAADLIYQQSSQRETISDVGISIAGVVQRDIRSISDRNLDILFGGQAESGLDFDTFTETIGVDPRYPDVSATGGKGVNSSVDDTMIPGLADTFFPDSIEHGRGSGGNISDMLNPALTEWHTEILEFGDGNPGVDPPIINDQARHQGHIDPNVLADITFGTVVNDVGRQVRFDYYFGKPDDNGNSRGHGRAWTTYTNQFAVGWDHHFNRQNTLKESTAVKPAGIAAPGHNVKAEWVVNTYEQSPTAILYRNLLHTKGVDNFGRSETNLAIAFRSGDDSKIEQALQNSFPGSLWEVAVDKEGLTKINIPAATALHDPKGNPLEPFREGRSLLMNMDGDATISVGKQKATGDFGLPRLTTDFFLNRNEYPNYGRKDRSLTLDLEGNLEAWIGADNNVNQGIIMQADGSIAMSVGREGDNGLADRDVTPANIRNFWNFPITLAAKASTRKDRSFTGKFAGNIELLVGSDEDTQQSIIISTIGGNGFTFGKDVDGQSVQLATTGGIDIQIQGPMQQSGYALHIDAQGVVHLRATGNIMVETEGQCHVRSQQDMSFESLANIQMHAAQNIDLTAEGFINLSAPSITAASKYSDDSIVITQGEIDVLTNKVNVNAPGGVSILGSLGVTGQFAVQGAPGASAFQIARIGDLVQVGAGIGQIISGSSFSTSI